MEKVRNGSVTGRVQTGRRPVSAKNVNARGRAMTVSKAVNGTANRGAIRPVSVPAGNTGAAVGVQRKPVQVKAKSKKAKKPLAVNRLPFWNIEGKADVPLLAIVLILLGFGITAMFSAGHAWAYQKNEDSFYFIKHQLPAAVLGLVGMFALMLFDYRFLRQEFVTKKGRRFTIAHILLVLMLLLNASCAFIGVSNEIDGPKRWIKIPMFGTFQPSDLLKVAVIIYMAYYIQKHKDVIRSFRYGMLQPALFFLLLVLILFKIQTHLSALLIVFMFSAVMLFVGGVNLKPAFAMLLVLGVVIVVAVQFSDFTYFMPRIKYMNPLSDPGDQSYQNYQSALALGSGGIWGKGFGNSTQKYCYLPEAQNDFVYAIWVEEFGLIGGVIVIFLFLMFILRGFTVARHAEDQFGMLIATGITFQVGLQALLNIGVNLCCIPNTGISLPFFSYGGTALMIQLWEMGLLLSISKRAKLR